MATRVIEKQVLYEGKVVKLELHHLKDDDGRKYTREVVTHPGAACILPILPDGQVILVRTRRYAVGENLLELPAGLIDPGETAINAAGRELIEETGYVASKLTRLASFYTSPGVLAEKIHAYVATGLMPSGQPTDEKEKLEIHTVSLTEALRLVIEGDILDAKTITTLLLFDAKRKAGQ